MVPFVGLSINMCETTDFVFSFEACVRFDFLCSISLLPLSPVSFPILTITNRLRLNLHALGDRVISSYLLFFSASQIMQTLIMSPTTTEKTKTTPNGAKKRSLNISAAHADAQKVFSSSLFVLSVSLSPSVTHTHSPTLYTGTVQLHTVMWEGAGRFLARESLCFRMIRGEADGTISEAAAAHPMAPSGAENQDNFIVIISLTLFLSLQPMKEEKT